MNKKHYFLFVSVLACVGCVPDFRGIRKELNEEVSKYATSGMPIGQAADNLSNAGFGCHQDDNSSLTCIRTKQHMLPYTCVDEVQVFEEMYVVTKVSSWTNCTGL